MDNHFGTCKQCKRYLLLQPDCPVCGSVQEPTELEPLKFVVVATKKLFGNRGCSGPSTYDEARNIIAQLEVNPTQKNRGPFTIMTWDEAEQTKVFG